MYHLHEHSYIIVVINAEVHGQFKCTYQVVVIDLHNLSMRGLSSRPQSKLSPYTTERANGKTLG